VNTAPSSLTTIFATVRRAYRYGGLREVAGCVLDGVKSLVQPIFAQIFNLRIDKRYWPNRAPDSFESGKFLHIGWPDHEQYFVDFSKRMEAVASGSLDDSALSRDRQPHWVASVEKEQYGALHVDRSEPTPRPLTSVIIPTRDGTELLEQAVRAVRMFGELNPVEIVIVDNGSVEATTKKYLEQLAESENVRILHDEGGFNWSRLNNAAARIAKGDVFVFLNNDIEATAISIGWLQRLSALASFSGVGCVGPMLLYPDHTIQHAGVVIGMGRWADHIYKGADPSLSWEDTPFIPPSYLRPVLAVTGACLAVSRKNFEMLGGFDEAFQIVFSDVEFCVRAHKAGLLNLYAGSVRLYHHESKSRDPKAVPDSDFREAREKLQPYRTRQCDPFFHPRLDKFSTFPKSDLLPTNLSKWIRG
jgi:GT2 family glycosyltransferase